MSRLVTTNTAAASGWLAHVRRDNHQDDQARLQEEQADCESARSLDLPHDVGRGVNLLGVSTQALSKNHVDKQQDNRRRAAPEEGQHGDDGRLRLKPREGQLPELIGGRLRGLARVRDLWEALDWP